jgi:hypothetical protein
VIPCPAVPRSTLRLSNSCCVGTGHPWAPFDASPLCEFSHCEARLNQHWHLPCVTIPLSPRYNPPGCPDHISGPYDNYVVHFYEIKLVHRLPRKEDRLRAKRGEGRGLLASQRIQLNSSFAACKKPAGNVQTRRYSSEGPGGHMMHVTAL